MKLVLSALIALNLAAAYAAPRNDAVVQIAPENDVAVSTSIYIHGHVR